MLRTTTAALLLALLAQQATAQVTVTTATPSGNFFDLVPMATHARLDVGVEEIDGETVVTLTTTGVRGDGMLLTWAVGTADADAVTSPWAPPVFLPVIGNGPQVLTGTIPSDLVFEDDMRVFARNVVIENGTVGGTNVGQAQLGNPQCAVATFDEFPAGTILAGQYPGITISADNRNPDGPDAAVIFNSATPTGGDDDLITPGYGLLNAFDLRNVLVIGDNVEDLLGGDGLVDEPGDEGWGGVLCLEFDPPIESIDFALLDIDAEETFTLDFVLGDGAEAGPFEFAGFGDNSLILVNANVGAPGFSKVSIDLSGSGSLAEFGFCLLQDDGQTGPN